LNIYIYIYIYIYVVVLSEHSSILDFTLAFYELNSIWYDIRLLW